MWPLRALFGGLLSVLAFLKLYLVLTARLWAVLDQEKRKEWRSQALVHRIAQCLAHIDL